MGSNLLQAHSGKLLASAAPWATVMPTGFLVLGYDFSAQETTGNHLLLTQFRASGSWPAGSWDTLVCRLRWWPCEPRGGWSLANPGSGGQRAPWLPGRVCCLLVPVPESLGEGGGVCFSIFLEAGVIHPSGAPVHCAWSLSLLSGGWPHPFPPLHTGPVCADLWSPLSYVRQGWGVSKMVS